MNYVLEELISDKELRKSLIEGVFSFTDEKGDFFAVDFQNESMRQNHITTYEVLYSLGGDELFERILKGGNTCLTNNPDSAKVGVKEIAGAKGWYLKTNASSFNAFTSIIYGLAALGDYSRFSFDTEEESSPLRIISRASENYETCLITGGEDFYSVEKTDDGSFTVVCLEENKPVTFVVNGMWMSEEISSFKIIEPVAIYTENYDEDKDEYIEEKIVVAYKFKLTENGKWGFFNASFSQFIPPSFDDVILTGSGQSGKFIAFQAVDVWKNDGDDNLFSTEDKNYLMYFGDSEFFDMSDTKINMTYACSASLKSGPSAEAYVDKLKISKEDKEVVFFSPDGNRYSGYIFIQEKASFARVGIGRNTVIGNKVKAYSFIMSGENTKKSFALLEDVTVSTEDYMKLYSKESSSYRAVKRLCENVYVTERDGYYGIAKMRKVKSDYFGKDEAILELDEMLAPYAFTQILSASPELAFVDRFGKKGLFSINDRKYVIPCDYDAVIPNGWSKYKVCKADFVGIIQVGVEVKWVEKLHREE